MLKFSDTESLQDRKFCALWFLGNMTSCFLLLLLLFSTYDLEKKEKQNRLMRERLFRAAMTYST